MISTELPAFFMGLFGGLHCVSMCGGVVGILCSATPGCPSTGGVGPAARSLLRKAPYWIAYHGGRIVSYSLLGALFGALGTMSAFVLPLEAVRFGLRTLAAMCMLAVGLHLTGLPSLVNALESLGAPLWRAISPLASRVLPLRHPLHAVALGGVWGLMPCGLLYGALALATSAESPSRGALTMASFGVATLPIMLTLSAAAQNISRCLARPWVRRAAGGVVLGFGLWNTAALAAQVGVGAAPFANPAHRCCPTR